MSSIIEYTKDNCPEHVTIGEWSYCYGKFRGSGNKVTIGRYTSIAENTVFDCGFNHDAEMVSTFPFKTKFPGCDHVKSNIKIKGDIKIGNDVTICEGCFIISGVEICDGAFIAANSVVTKDVSPYSMVGGSPAEHKKWRHPFGKISKLLLIKWWEWEPEKVLENAHLLNGEESDIDKFIELHFKP